MKKRTNSSFYECPLQYKMVFLRHLPGLWRSEASRKGVEAGEPKEGQQKEGKEGKGDQKEGEKKEGGEVARRPEHEGDVVFRDFFTPFFAGRLVNYLTLCFLVLYLCLDCKNLAFCCHAR